MDRCREEQLAAHSKEDGMEKVVEKLKRYAALDTQSDPESETCPSTEKQWALAKLLKKEMEEMGLEEIVLDENCYLFGTLPANTAKKIPTIGFFIPHGYGARF